jgi:hypothetical protein
MRNPRTMLAGLGIALADHQRARRQYGKIGISGKDACACSTAPVQAASDLLFVKSGRTAPEKPSSMLQ